MFAAKGCPVVGAKKEDAQSAAKQLGPHNLKVFNLCAGDLEGVKMDINNFSSSVEVLLGAIKDEDPKLTCLFVGDSDEDITLAMSMACAAKSLQTIVKMRAMVEEGITEKDWTEQLIKKSFEEVVDEADIDNFDIIAKLIPKLSNGVTGKILADKIVDMCDAKVNLRKCIKVLKAEYEKSGESLEVKLKTIKAVEYYFKIVCVCAYMRTEGETGYKKQFSQWLKENDFIEETIEHGIRFWKDMTFFNLV